MTTPIEAFAEFATKTRLQDLPVPVAEGARLKIADTIACAMAGADHEVAQVALRFAEALPQGEVRSVLTPRPVSLFDACFLNGVFIHAILQDDVDLATGHPACTVIGPALAVGEAVNATADELVTAIVLGYEAMWRFGGRGAFLMKASARGFRGNTILGAFGSAAATARLLGLDARRTADALAIAASFAAGLLEPLNQGTMERCLQQGSNARQGAIAAHLAKAGIDGCKTVLDGETGFYQAFADLPAIPKDAMDGLGTSYRINEAFAKPYPSAGSNTVGLAVVQLLMRRHGVRSADVAKVRMRVLPRFTGVPGYPSIAYKGPFRTVEQVLISFPFQVASMLAEGGMMDLASLRHSLADPAVGELAQRVELIGVNVPHPLWCEAEIELRNGSQVTATSDEVDWTEFHLERDTAKRKLSSVASKRLGEARAKTLVDTLLSAGTFPGPRAISDALHGSAPAR